MGSLLSRLAGVKCAIDVTAVSGSDIVNEVYQVIAQGFHHRTGVAQELAGRIHLDRACKLLIVSMDQWVSSSGKLRLLSVARQYDNHKKAADVRESVRTPLPGPAGTSLAVRGLLQGGGTKAARAQIASPQVGWYVKPGEDPRMTNVIRLDAPLQRKSSIGRPEDLPATPPTNFRGEANMEAFLDDFRKQVSSGRRARPRVLPCPA